MLRRLHSCTARRLALTRLNVATAHEPRFAPRSTPVFLWLLFAAAFFYSLSSHAQPLKISEAQHRYSLWPALTMLQDPRAQWTPEELIDRAADFRRMPATTGTLGVQKGAVWLRTSLVYRGEEASRWVLYLDYPPLQRIDVFVLWNGSIVGRSKLGSLQAASTRPFPGRAHAMPIDLLPNQSIEVLVRVQTSGAMILPISLEAPATALEAALAEQGLQGAMAGLALGLLLYSLVQWLALRDRIFLYYAIFMFGSLCFALQFFGLGGQYVWGSNAWVLLHASGVSGLVAVVGALLFTGQALRRRTGRSSLTRSLEFTAAITGLVAFAFAFNLINMPVVTALVVVLGLSPALLGGPRALSLAKRGNPVGQTMLVAWLVYFLGNAVMFGLIIGRIPVNFWTMHAFQFGTTASMLLFMRVLSLRILAHRVAAIDANRERDQMRSLAHTDPLTGLANRRGLDLAMSAALAGAKHSDTVAVYVIDLDGFKAVNDEFGHEVGDALLVAVAKRLEGQVRKSDLVARVGGDEFVVMVREPGRIHKAHMRGVQLLEAFHAPLKAEGHEIKAGLTIGYAVAPLDGTDAATLLRRADEALYEGKQDGKFCVRRLSKPQTPHTRGR